MRILTIGNSFSEDATRYLHQIARADGQEIEIVNLFVPGCTLEMHYRHMLADAQVYDLIFNGQRTGFKVSIKQAILSRQWDVVTMQQQSIRSADWSTFQPFADELYAYVKKCAPTAKVLLHQIWPVEDGSARLANAGYQSARNMFVDIEDSYNRCHAALGTVGIIPSGKLLMQLLDGGVETVHRDGLHITKGLGRYAVGLLWYRCLTGRTVAENTFCDFDEPVAEEHIRLAKTCVDAFTPVL